MASGDKYIVKREITWSISNLTRETAEKLNNFYSETIVINLGPNKTEW
jgi:hypothetical protein